MTTTDGLARGVDGPSTPARRSPCRSARRRSAACSTSSASRSTARARSTRRDACRSTATRAGVRPAVDRGRGLRDRPQGHRPDLPVQEGRQDRHLRRRRRRQDGHHPGADPQRRPGARAATPCSPASASAAARATTSSHEMTESGVIAKTAFVFGQMNEPPGARQRVGLTGLTMAEYFRDEEGRDVLLFIDNIFRFTQAGSEVSALLGRMPSAVGYQPNLATEMAGLQERITSTKKGSITSLQAVFVPADDYTDPAPATTFAHLDSTIRLERYHRRAGHLPGGRPADLDVARPRPERRRPGALRRRPETQARPAALPRPPGHHRDPRHRRAVRGGQGDRRPGPPPAAVHEPAVLRGRGLHRPRRASTCRSRTRSRRSRRSSRARPTRCPSRRSSSPAPSTTSARTPRSWRG